ncbi:MAG: NAD-dependent epimerase [Phycisphaerales bacterium]|nr:NAD-dependent epimerase [Phycisphaerales bacterium]
MTTPPVLVTGAAGFIGSFVSQRLLDRGEAVVGLDNLNDYYDPRLKRARLEQLQSHPGFTFVELDCADREGVAAVFATHGFKRVVHLAAQAGVRHSLTHPHDYVDSNITGYLTMLEGCRATEADHLVYASSSSVYGGNTKMPWSVRDSVDHPITLYAASKKANELMAHTYSHLFGLPTTGLRFFTVYGPWGRPDMALFLFTEAILKKEKLKVFNHGRHSRDFTYVDDIVEGIIRVLDTPATPMPGYDPLHPDPGSSNVPWRVYNIGNGQRVELLRYIELIEEELGMKADMDLLPLQPGDVPDSLSDVQALTDDIGYTPSVPVEVGVPNFVRWYREYYGV